MALFDQKSFDIILYFDINWQPTNYNQVSPARDEISDHWWSFHRPLQGTHEFAVLITFNNFTVALFLEII